MLALVTALAFAAPDLTDAPVHEGLLPPGQFLTGDGALVLTHTDVHARVMADLAVVDVTQVFDNPFDHAIDATYVFPLPVDAGVRDMTVTCGERVIGSEILSKEEARKRYDQARSEGRRAALLEQQADNVFTQRVAGLCPGERVVVSLQYVEALEVEGGVHSFVFPTTLGPRFDPGTLQEPPLEPATRPGRDLSIRLEVDAGVPLESIWSDTFPIVVVGEDDLGADIELLEADALPNKDLHVSWTEAGAAPQATALATTGEDGEAYVSLSLVPPAAEHVQAPRARELLFVLDSSCSMNGEPWDTAVQTVEVALDRLRPGEAFNLVRFSDAAGAAFDRPVPATPETIAHARRWMQRFQGGGTQMSAGIIEALEQDGDPEALRMVLLLTDGYIGNEQTLFRVTREHLGPNDRIFALGVGASTNRLLLDGLAHHGRGAASYQLPGTPIDETVRTFYGRIDRPALTDLQVDWGDLGAEGVQLESPPDLFAGQPLHLVARLQGARRGEVTVRGRLAGRAWETTVPVDLADAVPHEAVSTLWARREIQALERDMDLSASTRQEGVTELALAHRLVSTYTSLVAVDSQPGGCRAEGDVDVPQLMPEGIDPQLAENSGLLGVLKGAPSPSPGLHSLGGAIGSGGLGTRGVGVGGGGGVAAGLGSIGSGASGYGSGGGTFGSSAPAASARSGQPVIMGSIDRSLIQKTLRRYMGQMRYCYERELQKDPTLAGKITMALTIGPDGSVLSASVDQSTMNHEPVESCLVSRFRRMRFPAPGGGGQVVVRYPLVFELKD